MNDKFGHGWVTPRPDGAKARCGGPALCKICQAEAAALAAAPSTTPDVQQEAPLGQLYARLDEIRARLDAQAAATNYVAPSTSPAAVPTVEYVEGSWMAVAAPSASPAEAPAEPVAWQERQATRNGWSAWYHLDKAPSDAAMAARDDYQWRPLYAAAPSAPQPKTAPVAHFIESSPGHWHQAAREYIGTEGVIPLYAQPVAPAGQADDWCVKCHVHGHQAANCEAPAGQAAAWPTEEQIDAYLEDYEMRGEDEEGRDACHVPTEGERALIKDAMMGFDWPAPTGQAAAGVQGDAVAWRVRYSPNGLWHLSHSRCADDVYERQPLGVIAPAPAVERGVAEELADFKKWKEDKGKSCHSGRFTPSPMEAWLARAALSTAGKEQA